MVSAASGQMLPAIIERSPKMTSTLRARRRRQTAHEIQLSALRLSARNRYASITTDLISAEAGISPRTFFNYYQNKQAAIFGELPDLMCSCANPPHSSGRSFIADLTHFVCAMLDQKRLDRDIVCMIEQVCHDTPALKAVLHSILSNAGELIGRLFKGPLGSKHQYEAILIGQVTMGALWHSICQWASDETMTSAHMTLLVERTLRNTGILLSSLGSHTEAPPTTSLPTEIIADLSA